MRCTVAAWLMLLMALPTACGADRPRAADPASYLASIAGEFDKTWPNNRMVVVVCHGHSVPTGYFKSPDVRPFDSYPHLLHVAIHESHPSSVVEVIRTSIGGENAERGAQRFADDVLAKKPDVVTIDYALNDRPIGLERARAAWAAMIEQASRRGVKVLLLTPTPDTHEDIADPDAPLALHAQQIRDLAAEFHVGLVDSYAAFQRFEERGGDLPSLMSQPNHPNRKGHELVTKELAPWFLKPGSHEK
ncbi:hypothetical protein Pla175_22180 [Pirellulimonas nuda]|uniref:SGNH hydrolase-type esterase domain-containing protein n=1 Tax=Pirellulimonas nuda TaxID=2528009 RepID=A0A518DBH3_9BACT|nr:SGNH/GDSL hydrolase family protein [Pirellulimonas nuda]QDU88834.1 hypothetical protein Pla175_22180 [Pirellulimonas nuda]